MLNIQVSHNDHKFSICIIGLIYVHVFTLLMTFFRFHKLLTHVCFVCLQAGSVEVAGRQVYIEERRPNSNICLFCIYAFFFLSSSS